MEQSVPAKWFASINNKSESNMMSVTLRPQHFLIHYSTHKEPFSWNAKVSNKMAVFGNLKPGLSRGGRTAQKN